MIHRLSFIIAFLLPTWAQAATTDMSFNFSSSRSVYACSYAENQFEGYLDALGIQTISLRCSGGFPHSEFIRIRANVILPEGNVENPEWVATEFAGRESCEFNSRMIRNILSYITVRNLEARNSCFFSQGRYRYAFESLQ